MLDIKDKKSAKLYYNKLNKIIYVCYYISCVFINNYNYVLQILIKQWNAKGYGVRDKNNYL